MDILVNKTQHLFVLISLFFPLPVSAVNTDFTDTAAEASAFHSTGPGRWPRGSVAGSYGTADGGSGSS